MKKTALYFLICCALLLAAACNDGKGSKNNDGKLKVYTTVYPLTYFAQRIGGEYVNVSSIYPAGADEHHFEPTQKDMMQIADSDLFFYIGLNLEPFAENAEKTLASEHVKFINTSDAVPKDLLHTVHEHDEEHNNHEEHHHGDIDPHIWLSPKIAKSLALTIKNELVEKLPEQEKKLTENYNQLIKELDELDRQFAEMAQTAKAKTFFVSHEAFGYIAEDYGLEQIGISGINSQDEPSQKELTELVDLGKKLNIQYICFEQNVSSKVASVIQKELGAKSLTLHNLSVLTKEDIDNDETYFTLMKKNIETLQQALN